MNLSASAIDLGAQDDPDRQPVSFAWKGLLGLSDDVERCSRIGWRRSPQQIAPAIPAEQLLLAGRQTAKNPVSEMLSARTRWRK